MKKLSLVAVAVICFMLSGCTVAQYTYIRNLTEHTVDVYFDFDVAAMKSVPDSIYVPFSSTAHQVNKNAPSFMTDSIVAKRYSGTTLLMHIPTGGMIMFDKNTSRKLGYQAPEKIKVKVPGKEAYTVRVSGVLQEGERKFQTKGNSPKLLWYDIY